jgi:opacity protein-like surface antigen
MHKWMPYLAGGYANARYSHESHVKNPYAAATVLQDSGRFGGWYIGGGVDMAMAHGWTVGIEYRHYEFEESIFLPHFPDGTLSGDVKNIDPSMDTVTLRVSWKFGRPERVVPLK